MVAKRPAAACLADAQTKRARRGASPGRPEDSAGRVIDPRHSLVTTWKVERYGRTPACEGCRGNKTSHHGGSHHTEGCRARIQALYKKDLARSSPPFPWEERKDSELLAEFRRVRDKFLPEIRKAPVSSLPIPYSVVGMICSDQFFQFERMRTPRFGRDSMVELWARPEIYSRVLDRCNRARARGDKTGSDNQLRTLIFMNHPPCQFSTMTALRIYEFFGAQHVFDPYAGWGDRCLAAMIKGCRYYGIDSNVNLKSPFKKMIDLFSSERRAMPLTTTSRSERGARKSTEPIHVDIGQKTEKVVGRSSSIEFDFVFSSPPFFCVGGDFAKDAKARAGAVLEHYNGCETSWDVFLKESLVPVMKFCFGRKPDAWVCLYIPRGMKAALEKKVGKCRMELPIQTRAGGPPSVVFCWNARFGDDARRLAAKVRALGRLPPVAPGTPKRKTTRKNRCFKCGGLGHYEKTCSGVKSRVPLKRHWV